MLKTTVVLFTPNTARILVNPENLDNYTALSNAIVNPDLSQVQNVDLHYWKKSGSTVVEMTPEEKTTRDKLIDNTPISLPKVVEVVREILKEIKVEVPVEVIKYVDNPVEVIKYVDRPVEVIKEIPVEVVRFVERRVETIKEVPIETIKYVEKKIVQYVDKPVIQFEKVLVTKIESKLPKWAIAAIAMQILIIAALLVLNKL